MKEERNYEKQVKKQPSVKDVEGITCAVSYLSPQDFEFLQASSNSQVSHNIIAKICDDVMFYITKNIGVPSTMDIDDIRNEIYITILELKHYDQKTYFKHYDEFLPAQIYIYEVNRLVEDIKKAVLEEKKEREFISSKNYNRLCRYAHMNELTDVVKDIDLIVGILF